MAEWDWGVTPERVEEAVRRIVELASPLQVIVFGSQARGEQREDSDLDLAVIIEEHDPDLVGRIYSETLVGLRMSVDLLVVEKAKYELYRPWINSVHNYIAEEGVVVYDRRDPKPIREQIASLGSQRRNGAKSAAA